MKIVFLGAGAMGSWFGGKLAANGQDVSLLTTNQAHLRAIKQHGLIMHEQGSTTTVAVRALHPQDFNEPCDVVVLLSKTFQSDTALASIKQTINKNTTVLTLQNGLGNADIISRHVSRQSILIGNSMMPVDKLADGEIASKGNGPTYLNALEPQSKETARKLVAKFITAGLDAHLDDAIEQRIWSKVAFNAGMNAVSALAHGTPGTVGESPGAQSLVEGAADEVAAVANACLIKIDIESVKQTIDFACKNHKDHKASMLQDLLSGKMTEIDSLNGEIVRLGALHGIETPINTFLTTMIKLAEVSHCQAR